MTQTGGLRRVLVDDDLVVVCVCQQWQLEIPLFTPAEWIKEALEEHMVDCLDMQALRLVNQARLV